ncbi:glutathione S-transferase theta-1-like [Halichondria panicea]|uniref:glutathione S-transferase theta-1-like n=1 Tax=Halichondria panicea TaxID=6063 RepID=UPI00312BB5B1
MSIMKFFGDPISPVCRSVMLFLAANDIQHEFVLIDLKNRDTVNNEAFAAINPNQRIPVIDDNGFILTESSAILRYLAVKHKVADHWYPTALQDRARVDEALSFFPQNIRNGCFFHTCILPLRTGKPRDEVRCAELRASLKLALDFTENSLLKGKKFIGGDNISIADLQYLGEITQYLISHNEIYKGRPNMEQWMQDCESTLAPHFDKVFFKLRNVQASGHLKAEIDVSP